MILKQISNWLGSMISDLPHYLFAKTPLTINYANKDLWAGFYGEEIERIKEKLRQDVADELLER